tara:strand:+ start:26727 stop:26924 length:198 start_codon:yes stop_codon:yes gene_type:complete
MKLWKIVATLKESQVIGDCYWFTDLRTGERTITQEKIVEVFAQDFNKPVFKKEEIEVRKLTQMVP